MKSIKQPKCSQCKKPFTRYSTTQVVCSVECSKIHAQKKLAKKADRDRKDEARKTRAQKEAMKTLPKLIKEAQIAFNKFIRLRDIADGRGCISCGKRYDPNDQGPGGGWDAGHYRSVGSAPHMRFVEDNVHLQSKRENKYNSGAAVDYRIRLIERIGIERVEALERDNTPRNYTRDDVRAIRDTYRAKARALEKL